MKLKSIYVELIKICKKKSFVIFTILLLVLTSLLTIYVKNSNDYSFILLEKVNKEDYEYNYDNYLKEYDKYIKLYDDNILIEEYISKNNINMNSNIKNMFETSYIIAVFLSLFIISISSKSIGDEYEVKTIKNMLIRNKKSDIILSKLISLIIISLVLYTLVYLVNITTISIYNNFNIFKLTNVVYKNGKFIKHSFLLEHTCEYFKLLIPNIFIISASLFLSLVFKSSVLATVISMFITISSSFITDLLMNLKLKFISYTFLPYVDFSIFKNMLNIYLYNMENGININIYNGIFILAITSLILIISSIIIIYKREYK